MINQVTRKTLSISVAALFICMAFTVTISNNTKAEFVNTLAVPWSSSFTPIDSAWDSTGDHCVVVGNETSSYQSSAWYYNEPSGIWYNITEGGDPDAVPNNYIENTNTGTPYATIQSAIDAASSGDTIIVWSGTYFENINIDIPLTILGNNSANTIIDASSTGDVVTISTSGVNFYGFGVTGSGVGNAGILLNNADNCRIENNTIYANGEGIRLEGSSNNIIKENDIENNVVGLNVTGSAETKYIAGMTEYDGAYGDGVIFQMESPFDSNYEIMQHCKPGFDDGYNPYYGKLVQDGVDPDIMYGLTYTGGDYGDGALFKIRKDGSDHTLLHNFSGTTDGKTPYGSLLLLGTTLYGMTMYGAGPTNDGSIFSISTDGSGFTNLHTFTGAIDDGGNPRGSLTFAAGVLYGMTYSGGNSNLGTIFQMNTDGSSFSLIHSFDATVTNGRYPYGSLTYDGASLFGMTYAGGTAGVGTIFKINTDGSFFNLLHSFTGNPDGRDPQGDLTYNGAGKFYGMTYSGGTSTSYGTIFQINFDGSGYGVLHSFNALSTNGRSPYGELFINGPLLYGMTYSGGASLNYGTVFVFDTIGPAFNILHSFSTLSTNGYHPYGSLYWDGSDFYGMTRSGGTYSCGTIFRIDMVGSFSLIHSFSDVQLSYRYPGGSLLQDGSWLYAISQEGGTYGKGTVFKINTDGTGSSVLHSFRGTDPIDPYGPLTEGEYPSGNSLILGGAGILYGLTGNGGNNSVGTLFSINTDGSGYDLMHSFNDSRTDDGAYPTGRLVLDGGMLYGMTTAGGQFDEGTIYKYDTGVGEFSLIRSFDSGIEGAYPGETCSLILDGGTLYGMTTNGGAFSIGTIFQINTDGSGWLLLHSFAANGDEPCGALVKDGPMLYGMTTYGGTFGDGIIFEFDTSGGGFAKLTDFDYSSKGAYPYGSLILDGTLLYGMTNGGGGVFNDGTVFSYDIPTTGFSVLHHFEGSPDDGAYPGYVGLTMVVNAAAQSEGNLIYHNNFIDNAEQAWSDTTTPPGNAWDNGLPDGGNYWSNYTGNDMPPDGRGDTSEILGGGMGAVDTQPWMREGGWKLPYATFTSVKWDNVNGRFWLSGEFVIESQSSIFYIDDADPTTMIPIFTPPYQFTAVCPDNLGNILIAGNNLDAMFYYDPVQDDGYPVTEISTDKMLGWNITDITFNTNDGRFYVVGNLMNQDKAVAFHTDTVPLDSGSAKCYKDASTFLDDKAGLRAIEWNPDKNYALAVGDGIYRLQQYDGNPGYELTWMVEEEAAAGIEYYDISWDTDGWNEAGIAGESNTFGSYWRYYHTRSTILEGYTNTVAGTPYTSCAMKPPASPKWLMVIGPQGGLQINIQEKDESLEITFNTDKPTVFDVSVWKQSDIMQPNLLNTQIDTGTVYSFYIEANYTVGGVDQWGDIEIEISAWYDNGALGDTSTPGDWSNQNFRTRQFNLTYSVAAPLTSEMNYPSEVGGVQEFLLDSYWEDPVTYGADGNTHRLIINVSFGNQTLAANGNGFINGGAIDGNMWTKNTALNDQFSWDMQVFMYDTSDMTMYNMTYEEFGIKEHTSISTSGAPGGNAPPGASIQLLPSTEIYYSANTQYYVNISIPNLHQNGDPLNPNFIPATDLSVQNIHSLAAVGSSDIDGLTAFPGPDMGLYIWGISGTPLPTPVHGNQSAGPLYSDYSAAVVPEVFEYTIIDWYLDVPAGVAEGTYKGTIVITIFD